MECDFGLEIKSLSDAGSFVGLAACYNNLDRQQDVLLPGSFSETLRKDGPERPILWSHQHGEPVGLGMLSDSAAGLVVKGMLDLDTTAGREAHSRVKRRYVKALSIGFSIPAGGSEIRDGVRFIKTIDPLYEISLCTIPANPMAQITAAKSLATTRDFEKWLRDTGGFSKSRAAAIASRGFGESDDDADDEDGDLAGLALWLSAR